MVQRRNLDEAAYRGDKFMNSEKRLLGCNDVLCLSAPDIIKDIHSQYLAAGSDIIETCSFNATAGSLAEWGLQDHAYEINLAAAKVARAAASSVSTAQRPRFVAGSLGPTARSVTMPTSGDSESAARALQADYEDAVRGLLDGGVDILLAETIYDTGNALAALAAIDQVFAERGVAVPVMLSATVASHGEAPERNKLLYGDTVAEFYETVSEAWSAKGHGSLWAVGLNCSFGATLLAPAVRALAAAAAADGCLVGCYPNAGLPDANGVYGDSPEMMAEALRPLLEDGVIQIAGGCCGSTPEHIAAIKALTERL
jgi:5-methyltetrahydrofolate--homocysteine methyltransferase